MTTLKLSLPTPVTTPVPVLRTTIKTSQTVFIPILYLINTQQTGLQEVFKWRSKNISDWTRQRNVP